MEDGNQLTSALHDVEAEQTLLGAIISQPNVLSKVEHIISVQHFYEPLHQVILEKFLLIRDDGCEPTYHLVLVKLGALDLTVGDLTIRQYAAKLAAAAAIPNHVVGLALAVRDFAQRRDLVNTAVMFRERLEDGAPIVDAATAAMADIDAMLASRADAHTKPISLGEAAYRSIERMQTAVSTPDYMPGLPSGLQTIDHMTGGFKRGEFIVLAGRPGAGKSALAVTFARLQTEANKNILLFTLEMTAGDVADRAIADAVWIDTDPIPYQNMRLGKVSKNQQQRLTDGAMAFSALPLIIDPQGGLTLSLIRARARKYQQRLEQQGRTLDAIYLDHLHLVKCSNRYQGQRVQEVTEISNGLKALAKELNVPVIALAQLNRAVEGRDNKRPGMADLRDSGSIEQDADLIMMMFREEYYLMTPGGTPDAEATRLSRLAVVMNTVELNIVKQRNGVMGSVKLYCDIACNVFRDFDRRSVR